MKKYENSEIETEKEWLQKELLLIEFIFIVSLLCRKSLLASIVGFLDSRSRSLGVTEKGKRYFTIYR